MNPLENPPTTVAPFEGRRWNYFRDALIKQFGEVVYKIGVNAGFDCPNRDGTKAYGGCAYCSQEGSLAPHQEPDLAISGQINKGKWFIEKRYGAKKYIAYLQAFTNTYGSPELLRSRYESVFRNSMRVQDPDLVGLSIATRPDCINEEVINVLLEFKNRLPLFTVELGLQSAHQNRLEWVNRQEGVEDYLNAMRLLKLAKIDVITHIILGFPGETEKEMQETVDLAQECHTAGLKLQMLHVIQGTKLAKIYQDSPFSLFEMEEYGSLIVKLLERIHPNIQIHRITGETAPSSLIAPKWVTHKTRFFDWIKAELEAKNTYQGRLYSAFG